MIVALLVTIDCVQVQKRLQARKQGSNFNDEVTNMIEVLAHTFSGGSGGVAEDEVSLNSAQSHGSLLSDPTQQGANKTKGVNEKESDLTDEIDDEFDELRASPLLEKLQSTNEPKGKNISFMDYIRKKRNALVVLNNTIEGLSSSLEGSSGSILFGFAQNYSDPESAHQNTDLLSIDSAGNVNSLISCI